MRPTMGSMIHDVLSDAARGQHVSEDDLAKLPTDIAAAVRAASARLVGLTAAGDIAAAADEAIRVEEALHPSLVNAMFVRAKQHVVGPARAMGDITGPPPADDSGEMRAFTRSLFAKRD